MIRSAILAAARRLSRRLLGPQLPRPVVWRRGHLVYVLTHPAAGLCVTLTTDEARRLAALLASLTGGDGDDHGDPPPGPRPAGPRRPSVFDPLTTAHPN